MLGAGVLGAGVLGADVDGVELVDGALLAGVLLVVGLDFGFGGAGFGLSAGSAVLLTGAEVTAGAAVEMRRGVGPPPPLDELLGAAALPTASAAANRAASKTSRSP